MPGLNGPFVFDDVPNIVDNPPLHIDSISLDTLYDAAFSTQTGPLARPLPMASFALNYYWSGLNEFPYKVVNLVIHFFNGLLVFILSRKLLALGRLSLDSPQVALGATFASLCWMLHPLNLTSVLYVVQRMVELASMFGLLSVLGYLRGRECLQVKNMLAWHTFSALCLLLSILCKENMIVLVPLIAWLEWVLYRFQCSSLGYARFLKAVFCVSGLVIAGYLIFEFPNFQKAYEFRPFTMAERLLTQSRVLFFYLFQLLVPNIGSMHLFHDEFGVSNSLVSPLSTLYSIMGIGILLLLAIWVRQRFVLLSVAIGWFFIGHLVESTFISLEMVHNHRNYFPMIGFFFLLGAAIAKAWSHRRVPTQIFAVTLVVVFAWLTHLRAMDWSSWEILVVTEAAKNPESTRSQYEAGRYYYWLVENGGEGHNKEKNYEKSVLYFERGVAVSPTSLASLAALLRLADVVGDEPNPEWCNAILKRLGQLRPDPNDVNRVLDLFRCRMEGKCSIDTSFLSQVTSVAQGNEKLPHFTRAAIASAASGLALKEGRSDFAIYYALIALKNSPQNFNLLVNVMTLAKIYKDLELADMLMREYAPHFAAEEQERVRADYQAMLKEQGPQS